MLLADLKAMAGPMGIRGAGSMKKAQLIEAIKAAQSGQSSQAAQGADRPRKQTGGAASSRSGADGGQPELPVAEPDRSTEPAATSTPSAKETTPAPEQQEKQSKPGKQGNKQNKQGSKQAKQAKANKQGKQHDSEPPADRPDASQHQDKPEQQERPGKQAESRQDQRPDHRPDQRSEPEHQDAGEGEARTGRNRRRRGRDRNRAGAQSGQGQPGGNQNQGGQGNHGGQQRHEPDTTILEDDVVVPAAGILDVLDNYAFVRTSGYLPGPDDVYLSLSMVRKFGLRRGDAIVGQVRQPREGERREKFNPMVRIDSVNGNEPDAHRTRPEFDKLTPLHPSERLRLETEPGNHVGRIVDLVAPVAMGQRGLIVAPATSGKTSVLHSLAAAITANHPEAHLMVLLLDERPEEVTDYQRSVKGEVVSSTFDRPAGDHTVLAELAVERAKRLVELGHDVVILLDGITRLARAYQLSAPASGRVLPSGVDAGALYPPKRFLGAARTIENGGSLTILATAVEHGSAMDEAILEELRGTENQVLRLSRDLAEQGLYPAVDVRASGTRHEDLMMSEQELDITRRLRATLADLDPRQALEALTERLDASQTNIELLMAVQRGSGTSSRAGRTGP